MKHSRNPLSRYLSALVLAAISLAAGTAEAYPSAVVFLPSGETRRFGTVASFFYAASVVSPAPRKFKVSPWLSLQAGVLPSIDVGGGASIGGLEVGADLLTGVRDRVKPAFNAKGTLIHQFGWFPSISVGFMQFAPTLRDESLDFGYVMATEAIVVGRSKVSLGALTAGLGHSFAPKRPAGAEPVFHGTWPFAFGARQALGLGYVSPKFGILSFGVEHLGGYSEISGTNVAIFVSPLSWLTLTGGAGFANDRRARYRADVLFTAITVDFDLAPPPPPPPPPQ